MEDPVNPLLYVLGYGGRFVAQGTPADLPGLTQLIEEGMRSPGFAFINVQSPYITYGRPEATRVSFAAIPIRRPRTKSSSPNVGAR
jgi:pyruvate/2-oxoacid:ferredoxin oxidoreductase beta subunit